MKNRLTLAALEARCQKPDYRRKGTWMARRISRPLALRITWLISPFGVSAHAVTCLAMLVAVLAAGCFARGTTIGCLSGAVLFQLWYLLDHVDGQLARLNGTPSLDGIQLDYLMHHLVNLVVPCGLGYGVWKANGGEWWLWLGFAFALGLLLLGLANDTRYKAFMARLKDLEGSSRIPHELDSQILVLHRRVAATEPCAPSVAATRLSRSLPSHSVGWHPRLNSVAPPGQILRAVVHLARKLCEVHVVMNMVTAIAIIQCLAGGHLPFEAYLTVMAPLALLAAIATLARDIRRGAAEREFARWCVPHAQAGIEDCISPNGECQQRTEPEIVAAGDFVTAGDAYAATTRLWAHLQAADDFFL